MANSYFDQKHNVAGVATRLPRRKWGLLAGVALLVLGILILLLNLPGPHHVANSTSILVRDGLIVKGSGPTFYMFKSYRLHPISSPTPAQQAQAQRVEDDFLTQFACAEPVDDKGELLKELQTQENGQLCPPHWVTTTSPASALAQWGWLGGIVGLVGGGWWLIQLFYGGQSTDPTHLKVQLQQAAIYTAQIEHMLKSSPSQQRQQLLSQIYNWQKTIEELVQGLAGLRQNDLVNRDVATLPKVIADLEQQLATEINPALRPHLEHIVAQRKGQLLALEQLQITIQQAEIQVETTVALLGTIYSQLLIQQSTSHVADYQRLADNVNDEVQRLRDYLEALQEVKHLSYQSV